MDSFYTPQELATAVVKSASVPNVKVIADFAAGSGALLLAARRRWRTAALLGTDIDDEAVFRLSASDIAAGKCDFLNRHSRSRSPILRKARDDGVCLGLLNPPFSCRGSTRYQPDIAGEQISCSKAMAFLLLASRFIRLKGQIVSVLPSSVLASERDAAGWHLLARDFNVAPIRRGLLYKFRGVSPSVDIVRLTRRMGPAAGSIQHVQAQLAAMEPDFWLSRGAIPMPRIADESGNTTMPLVHSTGLRNGTVHAHSLVRTSRQPIKGPAVLLPRVGRPSQSKVCIYSARDPIVLSDCVLAIEAANNNAACQLREALLTSWNDLERLYVGTGAPYTTLARLREICTILGFGVALRPRASELFKLLHMNRASGT